MEAYGIFEGGGAKGLAHVGALKAAENRRINFHGVAGTSAGAIVASLIAAGYSSDELFNGEDPCDTGKIYSEEFLQYFGPKWRDFVEFIEDTTSIINHAWPLWAYLEVPGLILRNWSIRRKIKKNLGAFSTEIFREKLEKLLQAKVKATNGSFVSFEDIKCPLKIVATDISSQKIIVFSRENCPEHSVAKAVAASICLPIVFEPVSINMREFSSKSPDRLTRQEKVFAIDGGILSNFPAWIFDNERSQSDDFIPTIGFRLIEKTNPSEKFDPETMVTIGSYLGRIARTTISGDPLLETRQVDEMHEVPIVVSASTLQFSMSPERKLQLFNEGLDHANRFFSSSKAPKNPIEIQYFLDLSRKALKEILEIPEETLIRANITTPVSKEKLAIRYSIGMETDTDDTLEFRTTKVDSDGKQTASGACGKCWTTASFVICDLTQAQEDYDKVWRMDKYQQALVRKDLKSLLCVPIFNPGWSEGQDPTSERLIGILNFDSPEDLLSSFAMFATDAEKAAMLNELSCAIGDKFTS
jgi:NTE family protein